MYFVIRDVFIVALPNMCMHVHTGVDDLMYDVTIPVSYAERSFPDITRVHSGYIILGSWMHAHMHASLMRSRSHACTLTHTS